MSDQDFKDRVLSELGEIKGIMKERCQARQAEISGLKRQYDRLGERTGKLEVSEHRRSGGMAALSFVGGILGAGAVTALKWITGGAQ